MPVPHHVLLIPAPGDPGGLLREGPCGARPPTVIRSISPCLDHRHPSRCQEWRTFAMDCDTQLSSERVLVLAWGGESVDEGCDRACRALFDAQWKAPWPHGEKPRWLGAHYYDMNPTHGGANVAFIARACEAAGLGTAIVVEAT